jgi:ribosome modulation factor
MIESERLKNEGRQAWLNGISLGACPYSDVRMRADWRDGPIKRIGEHD